jgi:hypothetical protein
MRGEGLFDAFTRFCSTLRSDHRGTDAMRPFVLALASVPALLMVFAGVAEAQALNHSASPIFGTIRLSSGFSPDPYVASVNAGGPSRNPVSGEGCTGYLTLSAPDLKVDFVAGALDLTFSAHADEDLSLVVRTPDGRFYCDDDSGEGLDPLIQVPKPTSGEYAVWVATFAEVNSRPLSRVTVSELGRDARYGMSASTPAATSGSLDWRPSAIYGTVNLRAGFTPDPHVVEVNAGGTTRNPLTGPGCTGYLTASAPDLKLNYTAGSLNLYLSASASEDLSMVVRTPDGRFLCDDDSGEGLDPLIQIDSPVSGEYSIWIATYEETNARPRTRVLISEIRPEP